LDIVLQMSYLEIHPSFTLKKPMEMDMVINRSKLAIVSLFMIIIFSCFLLLSANAASRGISVISDLSHKSGKLGSYRALLIGISDYNDPKIPDLETAVNDASAMAKLLRERYGFQVKLLLNRKATREGIYRALRKLASSAKADDSVLIYYAGHGDLDRTYDDGWWIPVDAKGGNPVTYLDNGQVQKAMRSMKARHVLLISDSCYSGTLFGQARAMPPIINDKYYLNLYNEKSRWGMTSGNKTPVSDRGTGGHSVFAYQLLKELRNSDKPYISTQELYTHIAPIICNNSEQTPLCRPIRNTGDQGGEFVFVASSGAVVEETATKPPEAYLSVESNVSGAKVFVDGRYIGKTNLSGIKISSGDHKVRVEKDGYEPYSKRVRFKAGRSMSLTAFLDPKTPPKSNLYVDAQPKDARVRILNIGPKFYQGIPLDAGRYHVEVSANGYGTQKMWVSLTAGQDKTLDIHLKPKDSDPTGSLKIDTLDVNSKFLLNVKDGKLFVITGQVKNGYSDVRRFISINGRLYKKGKILAQTETVFCGNVLSDIELTNMEIGEIKKRLSNRIGDNKSNMQIKPGGELPFMIVFSNLPDNLDEFSIEVAGSSDVSAKEIARDGRFIAYDNGTVKDTKTGLMWASKDNGKNINWEDAKRYCENYRGGGYTDWRMPTQHELAVLYDPNEGYLATQRSYNVHLTKLIELSTCCPWASETFGSLATIFNFTNDNMGSGLKSSSNVTRALPVRGGN
jgi:caspase domain-containing protein/PEGA domain-containing protein/uncharacterized protein DUF1566/uncharacterized protein DUF3426